MSGFSILHDVSQELRAQIFAALDSAPDVNFPLTTPAANIALSPPNDTTDAGTLASLYLYHVDIDRHLRNQWPLPDPGRPDAFRLPPLPLQLRYLLTPVDEDELNNQLLLGRAIQHFHDAPNLATLDGAAIGDSFGGASPELRVRPDLLSMEQLSQVWSAFSTPYRLSVTLLVEVVAVDSARPPRRAPRVGETLVAAGLKERGAGG